MQGRFRNSNNNSNSSSNNKNNNDNDNDNASSDYSIPSHLPEQLESVRQDGLSDAVPAAIAVADRDGRCLSSTRTAEHIQRGRDPAPSIGRERCGPNHDTSHPPSASLSVLVLSNLARLLHHLLKYPIPRHALAASLSFSSPSLFPSLFLERKRKRQQRYWMGKGTLTTGGRVPCCTWKTERGKSVVFVIRPITPLKVVFSTFSMSRPK